MKNNWSLRDSDAAYSPEEIQKIARRRKVLHIYGGIYFLLVCALLLVIAVKPTSVGLVALFAVPFMWAAPFVIGALAIQIHGRTLGIFFAFLSIGCVVGIIMLIILNLQATEILRRHGYPLARRKAS